MENKPDIVNSSPDSTLDHELLRSIGMGTDFTPQYPAKEDDCIYFYDENRHTWKKVCDVPTADLPMSVKAKVREDQNMAEQVLNLPLK